jgi:hypothetical protein
MADISITAANVSASSTAVISRQYNFGATVTAGQLVYLDSNNRWVLMDANAAATGNGVTDVRGIALCGGANTQPATVVLSDTAFTPGGTLTNGLIYCASANAGALCPSADVASGNYPTVMGIAKSTTVLNLQPFAGGTSV